MEGSGVVPLPDLTPFLQLRRFLTVAHHVPGRIRLMLDLAALAHLPKVDPAPFVELVKRTRGVRSTRVNAGALSVVVDYDTGELPMAIWGRLLAGDRAEIERIVAEHVG
jgi:hypothetical protein